MLLKKINIILSMHLCEMAVLPFEINQQCRQRLTNKLLHLKILQPITNIHIFPVFLSVITLRVDLKCIVH